MKMIDVWVHFGKEWATVARECKISWGSIRNWRIRDTIPYKYQLRIEQLTNGALKADINTSDLVNKKMNKLSGMDVERYKKNAGKSGTN